MHGKGRRNVCVCLHVHALGKKRSITLTEVNTEQLRIMWNTPQLQERRPAWGSLQRKEETKQMVS